MFMALLLVLDAVPVRALLAPRVHGPVMACCCTGECHCRHCDVHRPPALKLPPGTCAIDCAGCAHGRPSDVTVPASSMYDVPAVTEPCASQVSTSAACAPAQALACAPRRIPDPPPRRAAA